MLGIFLFGLMMFFGGCVTGWLLLYAVLWGISLDSHSQVYKEKEDQ